jgi:two-component system response regulator YesN
MLGIEAVEEAVNGEDALVKYEAFKPNLILADINMPKLDGLTFVEKIKAKDSYVKIAFVTGYDYFDYAVQALKLGVDDYVLKPISKKDIEEVLRKLINNYEADLKRRKTDESLKEVLQTRGEEHSIDQVFHEEKFNSDFSLRKLSELMGYSNNYLSALFKKQYGMTFQDYLLHVRIEQAKIYLLSTDLKNYEIADKIGFTDVNYFGSRFKKIVGVTPKKFKSNVENGHED